MAKKSKRRASRFEKTDPGCMWGLISILDFRHARSSQKLLQGRKRGSWRLIGVLRKLDTQEVSSEIFEDSNSDKGIEAEIADAAKINIKDLMEEEMIGERKKNACKVDKEPKQTVSTQGAYAKKSRKRMYKKSFDLGDGDELISEVIASQKHKTSRSLDLGSVMEELCNQIAPKPGNCSQHNPDIEVVSQPKQDSSVKEGELEEATKVFIDYFTSEESFTKDGTVHPSKELLDALHIINSDNEIFLKLLQDPESQFLLHLQKLQGFPMMKDENSQLVEQVLDNSKKDSFFWRKFKSLERSLSKRNLSSQDLNKLAILKPGFRSFSDLGARSTSDDVHVEKGFSNFSFSTFSRLLKLALSKELQHRKDVHREVIGENGGMTSPMSSPRKDHIFNEKVSMPLSSLKKGGYKGKPIENRAWVEGGDPSKAEQRVSNVYVEAKKHIAEVVESRLSSDVDLDFISMQVHKSLGKILSLPDYRSPICSPRLGEHHRSLAIQRRLSPHHESGIINENACEVTMGLQEGVNQRAEGQSLVNLHAEDQCLMNPCTEVQGSVYQCSEGQLSVNRHIESLDYLNIVREGESCTTEGKLEDEASVELNPVSGFFLSGNKVESAVIPKISRSSHTEFQQKSNHSDSMSSSCVSMVSVDSKVVDALHNFEANGQSTSHELDAPEISSSSASWSGTSPTKEVKDLDGSTDRVDQASPASVLDQIFEEDDVSSPCTESLMVSAVEPIQPRQINFEEQVSSSVPDRLPHATSSGEDETSIFEFVEVVMQKSGLSWNGLLLRSLTSECFLDPSLFNEVEFLQDQLCHDPKLIFDLIEESLVEICSKYLDATLPFAKLFIAPVFKGKDIFAETWERVDQNFKLELLPQNLEDVIAMDYVKNRHWTGLGPDTESVGIEIEETILEELIEAAFLDRMI